MAEKRTFSESTLKLEDINEQLIKRQVPNTYNPAANASSPMSIPILNRPAHNGLNAQLQMAAAAAKRPADQVFSIEDKVKPLIPPCKNCHGNNNVIEDERAGAYICTNCGLETGRIIIETAEWRSFGDGKADPSRVTAENQYTGLEDAVMTEKSGKKPLEQRRLGAVNSALDGLRTAFHSSDAIFYSARRHAEKYLQAPVDIIGQAPHSETLAAVCFYTASLDAGHPIKKAQLLVVAQLQEKRYNKTEKRFRQAQDYWDQKQDRIIKETNPVQDSLIHLNSYAKRLAFSKHTIDAASCIIKTAYDLNISRNSKPSTIAAGTLLFTLALQERPCNTHELARLSATTVETIRRHGNELYSHREDLVPEGFVELQQIQTMKSL